MAIKFLLSADDDLIWDIDDHSEPLTEQQAKLVALPDGHFIGRDRRRPGKDRRADGGTIGGRRGKAAEGEAEAEGRGKRKGRR
jgi:hypothetical protein